jgi:hypothetical protein
MSVQLNCYGISGEPVLLKTIQFEKDGDYMVFKELNPTPVLLPNSRTAYGNFLSIGTVVGYNSSNATVSIPSGLRFRITLEVFKDDLQTTFSLTPPS